MIGPLLIFDKSFLEMLNPEELSELSMHFKFVGTPLLIREIISDLKKDRKDKRLPEEVVSGLAAKMWTAHGVQPANFRKLAIADLCGAFKVPMFGQVPVDPSAPNVHIADGGRGLIIDSTVEQEMWERWANGDFTTDDQRSAKAWRSGVQAINLHAVGKHWKEFASQHFSKARNLAELISLVDVMMNDFSDKTQFELLGICISLLDVPPAPALFATSLFLAGLIPRLKDFAPYAAAVMRLYLTFIGALARGFVGPRPSHYVDLQYLFYVPFCMVFVSSDKFHREMWPAVSGINSFVWGPDLKLELRKRVEVRAKSKELCQEPAGAFFPSEMEDSIVNLLWGVYMKIPKASMRPGTRNVIPKTVEELEPEMRNDIRNAQRILEEARRKRQSTK